MPSSKKDRKENNIDGGAAAADVNTDTNQDVGLMPPPPPKMPVLAEIKQETIFEAVEEEEEEENNEEEKEEPQEQELDRTEVISSEDVMEAVEDPVEAMVVVEESNHPAIATATEAAAEVTEEEGEEQFVEKTEEVPADWNTEEDGDGVAVAVEDVDMMDVDNGYDGRDAAVAAAEDETTRTIVREMVEAAIQAVLAHVEDNGPEMPVDTMTTMEGVEAETEAELAAPPSTAQKAKKSVRFTASMMGTPEGAAADVTATLPSPGLCPLGANEEAVVIDDNTFSFAQWAGLGAHTEMVEGKGEGEENAEDRQSTPVPVGKRGRRSSAAPGSVITTHSSSALVAKLTELEKMQNDITFDLPADFMRWTPAAGAPPAVRPSATRVTVAVNINPRGEAQVVFGGLSTAKKGVSAAKKKASMTPRELAAQLVAMEQQQDVDITFELPADFMKWTPAPNTSEKKTIGIGVTPRSVHTPATAAAAANNPIAGPAASSLAEKLAEIAQEHDVDFDLPVDFMRWTPAAKKTVSIAVTPRPPGGSAIHAAPISAVTSQRSARKTPMASVAVAAAAAVAATPGKIGVTPAGPGARAPAPTPATAPPPTLPTFHAMMGTEGTKEDTKPVDASALAAKLFELAEQHDVTFELPADFLRWTPAVGTANKSVGGNILIAPPHSSSKPSIPRNPVSAAKGEAMYMFVPGSINRSRMAQRIDTGDDDVNGVAEEVVQPMSAPKSLPTTVEAAAGASVRKTTPPSSTAAVIRRRRSSVAARTPGSRIVIIGGGGGAAASARRPSTLRANPPTAGAGNEEPNEREEMVRVAASLAAAAAEMDAQEQQQQQEEMMEEDESDPSYNPNAPELGEEEDDGAAVQQGEEEQQQHAGHPLIHQGTHIAMVSLADYRRVMLQARVHRARAIGLANQLRGVSARALRLKKAGMGLAQALEEERAKRMQLQETLQQIVNNRDAAAEGGPVAVAEKEEKDEDAMMVDSPTADADPAADDGCEQEGEEGASQEEQEQHQQRVVVVGYRPPSQTSHIEMAGSVVVVRPQTLDGDSTNEQNQATPVTTVFKSPVKVAIRVGKTPAKTPRSATTNHQQQQQRKTPFIAGGGRVVDDVEVPAWVFEGAPTDSAAAGVQPVMKDVSAALAEVAAATDAEAQDVQALKDIQAIVAAEVEAEDTDQEDDGDGGREEEDERCHVCTKGEEGDVMLLCDGCDNACHLSCCNPPLKRVPKGDWFCTDCKAKKAEVEADKKTKGGKKNTTAAAPTAGRGRKRAAATAAVEDGEEVEKKRATARGGATKRGRTAKDASKNEEEDAPPAPKRTRSRQATNTGTTDAVAAAPKRSTRASRR